MAAVPCRSEKSRACGLEERGTEMGAGSCPEQCPAAVAALGTLLQMCCFQGRGGTWGSSWLTLSTRAFSWCTCGDVAQW